MLWKKRAGLYDDGYGYEDDLLKSLLFVGAVATGEEQVDSEGWGCLPPRSPV